MCFRPPVSEAAATYLASRLRDMGSRLCTLSYLAETLSAFSEFGFQSAIIVSRPELALAHVREALDLLREERSAQVDSARFLGAARSKTHVRGRPTPLSCPIGEFLAEGPVLHLPVRYVLTVKVLVGGGEVGFLAMTVRATKQKKQGIPELCTPS